VPGRTLVGGIEDWVLEERVFHIWPHASVNAVSGFSADALLAGHSGVPPGEPSSTKSTGCAEWSTNTSVSSAVVIDTPSCSSIFVLKGIDTCHLGQEDTSQSKRGLRTRPLLLSRLSAMRPLWSVSVPLPWWP
jgi:hypothetical protein